MADLRPCPFCGGNDVSLSFNVGSTFVECEDCGACGPNDSIDETGDGALAARGWNSAPREQGGDCGL